MSANFLPQGFEGLGHTMVPEDLEALLALREEARKNLNVPDGGLKILEVGSFVGRSALALANRGDTVYCVDTWCGGGDDEIAEVYQVPGAPQTIFTLFCLNTKAKLFKTIFPCKGTSVEWAVNWPFPVDMIFIDADHTEQGVRHDLCNWRRHVKKPGGVFCGHDYGCVVRSEVKNKEWTTGVHLAVDALIPHRQRAGATVWYEYVE